MNFQVRLATESDGAALAAFFRRLLIPARVPVAVSRGDDCFALARLRGGESYWLLAESDEGGIVGALELAVLPVAIGGGTLTMAYVAFAGVDSAYRRRGVLLALAARAEPLSRARGSRIGALLHNKNNLAIEQMMAKYVQRAIAAEPIAVATLAASGVLRPSRDYRYEPARAEDMPAAQALLRQRHRRYTVAPMESLGDMLARLRLPEDACWVARTPQGEVAAFLGAWDQQALRPIALGRLPALERCARAALNLVAPALGLARLPRDGEALRLAFALAPAAIDAAALRGLLRAQLRYLASRGYHGLLLALPRNDSLWPGLAPWWALHNENHPLLVGGDAEAHDLLLARGQPVLHMEYGLV